MPAPRSAAPAPAPEARRTSNSQPTHTKVTGDLVESRAVVEGAAKAIDLQRLAALK